MGNAHFTAIHLAQMIIEAGRGQTDLGPVQTRYCDKANRVEPAYKVQDVKSFQVKEQFLARPNQNQLY